jgi:hypothetical protein
MPPPTASAAPTPSKTHGAGSLEVGASVTDVRGGPSAGGGGAGSSAEAGGAPPCPAERRTSIRDVMSERYGLSGVAARYCSNQRSASASWRRRSAQTAML